MVTCHLNSQRVVVRNNGKQLVYPDQCSILFRVHASLIAPWAGVRVPAVACFNNCHV